MMAVLLSSSPLTAQPAGTLIGEISSYLPVDTLITTGVRGAKVSST